MTEPQHVPSDADVVEEWRDAHLPTVFASHHRYLVATQRETAGAVIAAAGVQPGDNVIDVGCGSGIPTLALATKVGPRGHVTATDPSSIFVAAVTDNARREGLDNVTPVMSAAANLPFAAGSFDAATCHFAVMFFPDVGAGLRRILDALRPGGRAGFAAWGPAAENTMFGAFWSAASTYLPPDPPPDPAIPPEIIPQPMRFANSGSLSRALSDAGFRDIREDTRTFAHVWPGPAESNLAFWLALTGIEAKIEGENLPAFRQDVLASLRRFERDEHLHFSAPVVIASSCR